MRHGLNQAVYAAEKGHGQHREGKQNEESDAEDENSDRMHEHHNHETVQEQPHAEWSFLPGEGEAGEPLQMELQISNADGEPIQTFADNHEKKLHLIIVREDLSQFKHVHPEYAGDGLFRQSIVLPAGGKYKLFADFQASGYAQTTVSTTVNVGGDNRLDRVIADQELVKTAEKAKVELNLSALEAGHESELTFTFRHAKTGAALTDLQPYLGAIGHVVIVSEDLDHYLHVHPANELGSGPEAKFITNFPTEGVYRIWGQFQREGESFIVPFTVNVQ